MSRVPPDQPVKEARQRPQRWREPINGSGTMHKQWPVEFHDDFAPEVRQFSQAVQEKLKAAAIILSEDGRCSEGRWQKR